MTKQRETRERVFDLIEQLDVGEAIPSERQLSADLGVSRLTVRAALDDLTREGYLIRRRGSGTFVSEPKIAQELTMTSFTEDMRRRGMEPGSSTLPGTGPPRAEVGPPDRSSGARGDRAPGPAGLHRGHRPRHASGRGLRLADRETMAIETLHVREALVPDLTALDLEGGSFYELLRSRYGIVIAGGAQTIEPTVTNEEESEALGVPLHSPAFLFERVTHSESGEIVEFVHSIYRGDRYRLVTDLTAVPSPRRPPLSGVLPGNGFGQDQRAAAKGSRRP